ncbi:IS1380 family transposase [Rhodococcus opacus]|nr:IS1380 family transposase [Rhodococcus opacus]
MARTVLRGRGRSNASPLPDSTAGLVPVMALAQESGLLSLADQHLSVPTDKGSHAGRKIASLVGGMVGGADSITDLAILRHGAMRTVFDRPYAPSTLGSFLREFTFGHVRQLDAVASRFLGALADRTPLVGGIDTGQVLVDIDDSTIGVHGHGKQGSGYGYSGVRGLNALLTTITTATCTPVIVGQRLRRGGCGSPRGATLMVTDTLATVDRLQTRVDGASGGTPKTLVRADSAFYGHPTIGAAIRADADVSVTVRLTKTIKTAIASIDDDAWTPVEYTDAVYDEAADVWISRAEVAEIPFTAFASQKKAHQIPGRLVVRRIPDLRPKKAQDQGTLFDIWRFHAFFTTTDPDDLDTVAADKLHRHHAIIEQVHADLKNSALAHLPSSRFTANAAWLVCAVMAFNLTRAAGTLTGDPRLAKATTGTIRRTIVSVPARIASSARRLTLHLPQGWPWETAWHNLFDRTFSRNHPIIA